jgi:hypothetical protein
MRDYNPEGISKPVKLIVCSVLAATAVGISTLSWNAYYHPKASPHYGYVNSTSVVTNSGLEKVASE